MSPPIVGPSTPAMPYMLVTSAIPNGLALKGTDRPKTARLPHSSPAAPAPEIVRPTIKAAEFGAAADTIEPVPTVADVRHTKIWINWKTHI